MRTLAIIVFLTFLGWSPPAAAEFRGLAFVQADGHLLVSGRMVRLHGIHIPETGRQCRTTFRPIRCGSRAILALETKIEGFVRCQPIARGRGGVIEAICFVRGDGSILADDVDLGAWLISQGWALAGPRSPFAYRSLERIAQHRNRGVWGFQVDAIR